MPLKRMLLARLNRAVKPYLILVVVILVSAKVSAEEGIRLAPGDFKQGYESTNYQTDSLSLEQRQGKPANLVGIAKSNQLGLPTLNLERSQRPSKAKIELGRKLFFDRRLSRNKTMSCAMCHVPEQGFTSNELERPIGSLGRSLKRNAPTILNVVYYERLFADARESSLAQQIWSPLLAHNEMNNPSVGYVIDTINSLTDYKGMFEKAFKQKPTMLNVGEAIAQYERALISANSAFDRWRYGGEKQALTKFQQHGFELFTGKAACVTCHTIGKEYALFTDNQLHSTGIGFADSMLDGQILKGQKQNGDIRVQLAPGVFTDMSKQRVSSVGETKPNDVGRYEITLHPDDRWKFRTASLRNIALTAPYMHNGALGTLQEVVAFYNQGGVEHAGKSPLIRPLNLTEQEQAALVAFMQALTGSNVKTLVADAFAAPVGDTESR